MANTVVCFGEALWDVLPTSKQPGGSDELRAELLAFLAERGVRTTRVQRGHLHPLGVVKAT